MTKKKATTVGKKLKRGERMAKGKGWRLVGPSKKMFKASLIKRLDIGGESALSSAFCLTPEKNRSRLKDYDLVGTSSKAAQRRQSHFDLFVVSAFD